MRRLLAAAILALAPLAATSPSFAAPAGAIELAQYQGEGGRPADRDRYRERGDRDADFRRDRHDRGFERPRERCHVEIVRRMTPFGVRVNLYPGAGKVAECHASPFATTKPGVFAVGDVRSGLVQRIASGVGEGTVPEPWCHLK